MAPVQLAHDLYGTESGSPVVFLHGLSASRADFTQIAQDLASKKGFRVLNVDLRGHGGSPHTPPESYFSTEYANDVAQLIEAKLGKRPVLIVGHSLGGVVTAKLATMRPDLVKAVLLEDPPLYEGDAARRKASPAAGFFPKLVAGVKKIRAEKQPNSAYAVFAGPKASQEEKDLKIVALTPWDPASMESAISGLMWTEYDTTVRLACPVTVLAADPKVGPVFTPEDVANFAKTNPHAKIVTIQGAGHGIHLGKTKDAFVKELETFLATYSGAAAKL